LDSFSLEGGDRKDLRYCLRRLEKEGCQFEVIPPTEVPGILPALKRISDAWLHQKNTREKRFSLGFFDEGYLKRFPIAVVRREGRLLAFTNLLETTGKEELSLDLMRYLPEAPSGMMDYLFSHIVLWGKKTGYRWFSMGMVPLSGLQNRALATLWNRFGTLMFQHGEHFYNFQGLREYKSKFGPLWEPKYMASPGGLSVPRILTDIASLNSGGIKGIFGR